MPIYSYKGQSRSGEIIQASLNATSREDAKTQLKLQGITLISINEGKEIKTRTYAQSSEAKITGGKTLAENFLSKILQLHKGGMPVGDAVKTMRDRITDPQQKHLAQQVWQDLSEGATLAGALKRFPQVFDNTIIYAIEAGEASGNLSSILRNVVDNLKTQAALKKKIYSAMAYPAFICIVAICVAALFLFFLLPRIEKMMHSMGGQMGLASRILITGSDIAMWAIPIFCIAAAFFYSWIKSWRQTKSGLRTTDEWLLRLPFISSILKQSIFAQVSNLMATLLSSGVNTTESMSLTEKIVSNRIMNERFKASQKLINDGSPISTAFKVNHFYPDLALDILTVGENTGDIASSFREISNIFTQELETSLKRLTTTISSAALFFAFLMVAILAISIVTSVLQFSNTLIK